MASLRPRSFQEDDWQRDGPSGRRGASRSRHPEARPRSLARRDSRPRGGRSRSPNRRGSDRPVEGRFAADVRDGKPRRFAEAPAAGDRLRRRGDSPVRRPVGRPARRTPSRSDSSKSASRSARRRTPPRKVARGGGFDQSVVLPEDIAVKQALERMTTDKPIPSMFAPPVNPAVEQFLSINSGVEGHAAARLRALPPDQQTAVITHSLAGARDPTAVLIGRIRKVAGWVPAEHFPNRGMYPVLTQAAMSANQVQQNQNKEQVSQRTQAAAAEVEQMLWNKDTAARPGAAPSAIAAQAASRGGGPAKGSSRDVNGEAEKEHRQEEVFEYTGPSVPLTAPDPFDIASQAMKAKSNVQAVSYSRPFASKARPAPAPKQDAPSSTNSIHPALLQEKTQSPATDFAHDLLFAAAGQSSQSKDEWGGKRNMDVSTPGAVESVLDKLRAKQQQNQQMQDGTMSADIPHGTVIGNPNLDAIHAIFGNGEVDFSAAVGEMLGVEPFVGDVANGSIIGADDNDWDNLGSMKETFKDIHIGNCVAEAFKALKQKAIEKRGVHATIADLGATGSSLPSGLAESLAVKQQQAQLQEQMQQAQAAALATSTMGKASAAASQPMDLNSAIAALGPASLPAIPGLPGMPAIPDDPNLTDQEKMYQRAWLEHQMQAQMALFETQQAIGLGQQGAKKVEDPSKVGSGPLGKRKSHQPMLPGDWECPKCGDHQFSRNWTCRSCGALRPD